MQHSESLGALAAALSAAQSEIENAHKNANNPHFRSQYADLAELINTTRPVLTKHGLSLVQCPGFLDGVVLLETMLLHSSGEWIKSIAGAPAAKLDPQGIGSATTYLRRYALAAFCNIAQEDDDGNGASQVGRQQGGQRPTPASNGTGLPWDRPMPIGKTKGTKLRDLSKEDLASALNWCIGDEERADKFRDLIAAIEATLENFHPNPDAFR